MSSYDLLQADDNHVVLVRIFREKDRLTVSVGNWFRQSQANGSLPVAGHLGVREALEWSAEKARAAGLPLRVLLQPDVEWNAEWGRLAPG